MAIEVRVDGATPVVSESSATVLCELLERVGTVERDDAGDAVVASASLRAADKLRESVRTGEPVELDDEELASVRDAIDQAADDTVGGFDSVPLDLVELRHAITNRRGSAT